MFDISNPANPVEVGKYETWRDPDGDGTFNKTITGVYNGAWNLHVFLPSGNVLLSDMKSGTFIFRVDPIAPPGTTNRPVGHAGQRAGQPRLDGRDRRHRLHRPPQHDERRTVHHAARPIVVGTSFTDTGLTNGTTYYYVVTATNAEGEGPNSNQASATPAGTTHRSRDLHLRRRPGRLGAGVERNSNAGGSTSAPPATTSALRVGDATRTASTSPSSRSTPRRSPTAPRSSPRRCV